MAAVLSETWEGHQAPERDMTVTWHWIDGEEQEQRELLHQDCRAP